MKLLTYLCLSFLLMTSSVSVSAQRFEFMEEDDAEAFLAGILKEFGLNTRDIRIMASNQTNNAEADDVNGQKYIYYNKSWMQDIGKNYEGSEFWLKMGVITHEIGHHFKDHTFKYRESDPQLELEADWWSGFAMRKLGATLQQALTAVKKTSPPFEVGDHPARKYRIEAVTKGYHNEAYHFLSTAGTFRDKGGNAYTYKTMLDGRRWLTQDLEFYVNNSKCPEDLQVNCDKYGRLYTWEAAKQACAELGNGWRLPTDDEWWELVKHYTGAVDGQLTRSNFDEKKAYEQFLEGAKSGFNVKVGEEHLLIDKYINGARHIMRKSYATYWTASKDRYDDIVYIYQFREGFQVLERTREGVTAQHSARCILDE